LIIILGGGLAGLSTGYHLRNDKYLILEKENQVGGLCRSVNIKGYVFDYAPHIFFTRNDYVMNLVTNLLKNNLIKQIRKAYIYLKDTYVEYPFEVNLNGLPEDVIKECINGVINRSKEKPRNFKEWIYTTFGEGIAKHYMIPYNEKIWKYDLSKMNIDWISDRVPSPSVEDMKKGAVGKLDKDFGPNAVFFYPKFGGIGALAQSLAQSQSTISLNSEVIEIKHKKNETEIVYTKNNEMRKINSKYVISSIPLPTLIKMFNDVPEEVIKAAKSLVFNSLVCINIGIKRPKISEKNWIYFPEKDLIFNRISFPMNFSEFTTPRNRSSILIEVTHRRNEIDIEEIKEKVIDGLITSKIIRESDKLDVCDVSQFKYAYVIYDLNHKKNVRTIHEFLKDNTIIPIGRYGEWKYLNMDKAILSGKNTAIELNEGSK